MDTLERDYRCPFRWLEDGRDTRCEVPDAREHSVHLNTETERALVRVHLGGGNDYDHDLRPCGRR
jgi:hypothetical protein